MINLLSNKLSVKQIFTILVMLSFAFALFGTTYVVDQDGQGDFITIQEAVNAGYVVEGDIINANVEIFNCTIADNNDGLTIAQFDNIIDIENSIVFDNVNTFNGATNTYSISYSNIQGGFSGTGNINKDPKFCDNINYQYYLLEGSPCIDAGDPDFTDADDTRLDMGCYPTTTDIKPLEGNHWNWVSFPRLNRMDNNPVVAWSFLDDMIPMPNAMVLRYEHDNYELRYSINQWSDNGYEIQSSKGYRLRPEEVGDYILPATGSRLSPNYTIGLYAGQVNSVGYWLPETLDWRDALSQIFDHVTMVKAEDWYMYKIDGQWYGSAACRATFEYGKGYDIIVDENIDLTWSSYQPTIAVRKAETTVFTYEEQPNYEMILIDSVEGAGNIDEIGVFVDGVCVGASKVEGYPVDIQAYTAAANRGSQFTFEIAYGRGLEAKNIISMQYDFSTGKYIKEPSFPHSEMLTKVKLQLKESDEEDIEVIDSINRNYPNPFNPTTTIEFSLSENNLDTKLIIYNIKGQVIKKLLDGEMDKGIHTAVWNGTDSSEKPVASGLYFYKLSRGNSVENRKILLLK